MIKPEEIIDPKALKDLDTAHKLASKLKDKLEEVLDLKKQINEIKL